MISNIETLQNSGILAPVETVKIGFNGEETKFNLVVVDGTDVIDTVTDQYDLIPNAALVDAVDSAANIVGLSSMTFSKGYLNRENGNSRIVFSLDDGGIQVPGDESKSVTDLIISNNYAGRGKAQIGGGMTRLICSNGMTVFEAVGEDSRIHIGIDDLDAWALEVVADFAGKANVNRVLAEVASSSDWSAARFGDALTKTAPKRYRDRLAEAVKDNTNSMGFNAWAAIQAVTEVATHDMKDTITAQRWSDAAINKVLADVGQSWNALAAMAESA